METRATSKISSGGMGHGLPCSTPSRKAFAHPSWPYVLPPEVELFEAGPAVAFHLAEVVDLQHPTGGEGFDAFLGESGRAVGEIMDGAEGAILGAQSDARFVFRHRDSGMAFFTGRTMN